jgi:hypothetical protein
MMDEFTFYIYENWRAADHKEIIHRASCGDCKNGRGKGGGTNPTNGHWHGPYPTLHQAEAASASLHNVTERREHKCV